MDFEKRARRQSFRVIVSETIMVLAVVIMVAVLAFVVSGYWVNADFQVERQGMLQINSMPTGAYVAVDGEAPWYQRTNTSKVLSSGEHHIVLTRDGYDTWEKSVSISEGLLYRLQYPRLFLRERERESVYDTTGTTFATVSSDGNTMLLADSTTTWTLLNLDSDRLEPRSIDIAPYFTLTSLASGAATGLFTGEILSAEWSGDHAHLLIEAGATGADASPATEWVLLDIKNPKNSINLTREFAVTFAGVRIFDNSAGTLLALRSGNLHKIDISARQISAALVSNVNFYDFYGQDIVFINHKGLGITQLSGEPTYPKLVASDSADATDPTLADSIDNANSGLAARTADVAPIATDAAIDTTTAITAASRAYLSRFYETRYLNVITADRLTIYRQDDFTELASFEIGFAPDTVKVGRSGDFVFMNTDTSVATLDMESRRLVSWTLDSPRYRWLDNNMLYAVDDGSLAVYDYDGLNHRTLSSNVSSRFPVTITRNRWLYYFSDDAIIREIIAR